MKVIGIDPGIALTGYAILEIKNNKILPLKYGIIKTEKKALSERIKEINTKLKKIIEKYKPNQAGVEKIYFNKNTKTAIDVSEVRGSIILTLINNKVSVFDYTPLQVKQAIVGYGKATKHQIQQMIKILLNLKEKPSPDDVADALAVGVCHINSMKLNSIIRNYK